VIVLGANNQMNLDVIG